MAEERSGQGLDPELPSEFQACYVHRAACRMVFEATPFIFLAFQLPFVSSSKYAENIENVDSNLTYSRVPSGHLFYPPLSTSEKECALEGKSPLLCKFSSPTYLAFSHPICNHSHFEILLYSNLFSFILFLFAISILLISFSLSVPF